ncbi:MAG TPA: GNAT family N-acetyltransferase [Candidatus Baltobacteraceae bacterium]|nr:GNAT family N-acetyltransferase [Candidatus Baltobacteraceae bacterium]
MIDVRALDGEDWTIWRTLRLEALRESPQAYGSTYEQWCGASEERWLQRLRSVPFNAVAYRAERACGIVSGTAPDDRRMVELISLWVAPDVRGTGVGDALIRAVAAFARREGAAGVHLAVRESNAAAAALYRRHGFADAGPAGGDGPPERRMEFRFRDG